MLLCFLLLLFVCVCVGIAEAKVGLISPVTAVSDNCVLPNVDIENELRSSGRAVYALN